SVVALITRSRYLGLLKPFTNGGSGLMSTVPIAQVRPYCFKIGKLLGATSSMLSQPRSLATLAACSIVQFFSKHQYTIDCLIRPFFTVCSEALVSPARRFPENAPMASTAAPAEPFSSDRRLVASNGSIRFSERLIAVPLRWTGLCYKALCK